MDSGSLASVIMLMRLRISVSSQAMSSSAPIAGLTPRTAPGAETIGTATLASFLERRAPIVIDTLGHFWGTSLPNTIGLPNSGVGGRFTNSMQNRLERTMRQLTSGDLSAPIVAVGFNSERFDGRNLALRLVALRYSNVHWYRGGREAWEVAGLIGRASRALGPGECPGCAMGPADARLSISRSVRCRPTVEATDARFTS